MRLEAQLRPDRFSSVYVDGSGVFQAWRELLRDGADVDRLDEGLPAWASAVCELGGRRNKSRACFTGGPGWRGVSEAGCVRAKSGAAASSTTPLRCWHWGSTLTLITGVMRWPNMNCRSSGMSWAVNLNMASVVE